MGGISVSWSGPKLRRLSRTQQRSVKGESESKKLLRALLSMQEEKQERKDPKKRGGVEMRIREKEEGCD